LCGAEAVAVAVDGDGDAAVEEPVEEGCCDGGVGLAEQTDE
jgi:hypothetical protein